MEITAAYRFYRNVSEEVEVRKKQAPGQPNTVYVTTNSILSSISVLHSILASQPSTSYSEIHRRVQRILQTHRAEVDLDLLPHKP